MGAKWVLLALAMLGAGVNASEVKAPAQVRLVSEQWFDYTNADGTGAGWDVLREIFEPAGVRVVTGSAPYSRAIGLVKRGEADAWVGAYKGEKSDYLYPRWHFDLDRIYALGLASEPVPKLSNLSQFRLAWVRGYDYQNYLPGIGSFREVQRREGILSMLEHGRVDFYIDAETEVNFVLGQSSEPKRFRSTYIADLPLYLAFADNKAGHALRDLFDQRMGELIRSGGLRPIFDRWKQPYPFSPESQPL